MRFQFLHKKKRFLSRGPGLALGGRAKCQSKQAGPGPARPVDSVRVCTENLLLVSNVGILTLCLSLRDSGVLP